MLHNSLITFIFGWIIWFWIDKPRSGLERFLQADDSMLVNFQRFFDLLKSGYIAQSYIYIWNTHYLVLSLIGGVLMSVLYNLFSTYLMRRRVRHSLSVSNKKCDLSTDKSADEKLNQ